MESPLKERLTGALIVVAVLVIVVPEMLSGPGRRDAAAKSDADAGPPVRTYSLELGSNAAARTQDQSALTPQSAEPTAPAGEEAPPAAVPAAPVANTLQSPPAPAPAAAVAESPAPVATVDVATADVKAVAAKNAWWTQLGSFSSRDNAERLASELRGKGYSISVARIKAGGKDLFRVRAGPVAGREAAVALQARLAAAGHKSSLVGP